MANLETILLEPDRRPSVITDCVALIDSEVAAKTGLTGMAVKAAFAIVSRVKPGIILEAVDSLLDDFVARLDPFYSAFGSNGAADWQTYLTGQRTQVANALLGITDERASHAKNAAIRKTYEKLRPTGAKHVEAAVPGIARVIAKYL